MYCWHPYPSINTFWNQTITKLHIFQGLPRHKSHTWVKPVHLLNYNLHLHPCIRVQVFSSTITYIYLQVGESHTTFILTSILGSGARPLQTSPTSARRRDCHLGFEANSIKPHMAAAAVTSKAPKVYILAVVNYIFSGRGCPSSPVLLLSMMICAIFWI